MSCGCICDLRAQQKQPLPNGWEEGKIVSIQGETAAEKNMLNQFKSYCNSLFKNDINKFSEYLYHDMILYYKKFVPAYYDDVDIVNELCRLSSMQLEELMDICESQKVDIEMAVKNIEQEICFGDTLIHVFNITLNLYRGDKGIHDQPERTIGFSFNRGANWTFLAINEDTRNILRMRFNESIINKILHRSIFLEF